MDSEEARRWAKKVFCYTCKHVIRKAVQLCCCGVRLCERCVAVTCPVPRCGAANPEHFRDKAFERDCVGKVVFCPLCRIWSGRVAEFQAHLEGLHCSGDINVFLGQDSEEELTQMPASVINSSVESYDRLDEQVMQILSAHYDSNFLTASVRVLDEDRAGYVSLCGSCGVYVSAEKLHVHRVNCYYLTDYKDVCYPCKNPIFEESGFPSLGANEMVVGPTSVPIYPSCGLENMILQNISVENFEQYHDKITRQMKKMCKMNAPIEYPTRSGKMKWKISEVSYRSQDPEHPSIMSPCFYSKNGHSMRLKLDFDWPQNRLQLMIREGRDDDRLLWPCRGRFDVGLLNFGMGDGIYERSLAYEAPRCFSECGGNIAGSVLLPSFCNDFLCQDSVYMNFSVEAEEP